MLSLFKRKWFWISLGLLALVVAGYFVLTSNRGPQYITEVVGQGSLDQIVSVNGAVESSTTVDLRFSTNGTVESILVQVGQEVEAGTELARLDTDKLQAEVNRTLAGVQIQQAELDLLYAGPTYQEVQLSNAKIHEAEINIDNAILGLENTLLTNDEEVRQAELDVESKEIDLVNAQTVYDNALASEGTTGAQSESDIDSAYQDAQPEVATAMDEIELALDSVDLLLGEVDDLLNPAFDSEINDASLSMRTALINSFRSVNNEHTSLDSEYPSLQSNWFGSEVDNFLDDLETLLEDSKEMVDQTHDVLKLMESSTSSVQTDINTLTTTIEGNQSRLTLALIDMQNTIQAITDAVLGESSSGISSSTEVSEAQAAFNVAEKNLEIAESGLLTSTLQAIVDENNARMDIDIKDVQLEQRQAEHNQLVASPREVDLAAQRGRVLQADAIYQSAISDLDDAILKAPSKGIVAKIDMDNGENLSASDIVASFITDEYQVTANISETDIAKVSLNDSVSMTFDAFPIDQVFMGTVAAIDPAETVIQGAVYYEATIVFDEFNQDIKPGMTVNIDVLTDSADETIFISPQALQYEGSETFVFILKGGERVKRLVETGLEGERNIEILSGLKAGETIILYER